MNTKINTAVKVWADRVSTKFNTIPVGKRQAILAIAGLSIAILSGLILFGQILEGRTEWLQPTPVSTPVDIHRDTSRTKVQTPDAHRIDQ